MACADGGGNSKMMVKNKPNNEAEGAGCVHYAYVSYCYPSLEWLTLGVTSCSFSLALICCTELITCCLVTGYECTCGYVTFKTILSWVVVETLTPVSLKS